jgi:lipoprotein-anchoring transpeptidase ErfK/SrfK
MAGMERLAYKTPAEMFAERFHMDLDLLKRLNPDIESASAGTEIVVADVGERAKGAVKSIRVDKARAQLRGLDADGKILVSYPATVGSKELPSPAGEHKVEAIAYDAAYYYDPKNFEVDSVDEELTLPPGPNNPIGTTWIDLSEPTYGIHGAAEPADIDKEASHGCVRLTNWDVEELAELVDPGVEVIFAD